MDRKLLGLYYRTLRHIPAHQAAHRLRLRTQRAYYRRRPDGLEERWASGIPGNGSWPSDFEPLDLGFGHPPPGSTGHGRGLITAVGEHHDVLAESWGAPDRSQLFRYHMHYFEWAWPLASTGSDEDREAFERLWRSWRAASTPGRWDGWSPYVVALRSWVLCGVFDSLIRDQPIEADVRRNLRASLTYLERNLELDVGGNHLLKDLKAAIGLAVFFSDTARLNRHLRRLREQLDIQILSDGGHFELSPSYHAQVLVDLHDVCDLLTAAEGGAPRWLTAPIERMGDWLNTIAYPDATLPLIGDCSPPTPGLLAALRQRQRRSESSSVAHLEGTGHVVFRPQPDAMVVADFGPTCPPSLPAHGQADWGTFEVWAGGRRVVVDPGVSAYVGTRREVERSSVAHNTIALNGRNDSEVWGSFRVAAMATVSPPQLSLSGNEATVVARMEPFQVETVGRPKPRRPVIERRISVTASRIEIEDRVDGAATSGLTVSKRCDLPAVDCSSPLRVRETKVAQGFGDLVDACRVEAVVEPWQACVWTIDLDKLVASGKQAIVADSRRNH